MTGEAQASAPAAASRTLVWIDAAEAIIVRWDAGAGIEWLVSEVPFPLRQHLREVAERVDPTDAVEVIGPGTVGEQLASIIAEEDRIHHRQREVGTARSRRLSLPQLVARVRASAGASAPRVGRQSTGAS